MLKCKFRLQVQVVFHHGGVITCVGVQRIKVESLKGVLGVARLGSKEEYKYVKFVEDKLCCILTLHTVDEGLPNFHFWLIAKDM